MAAKHAPRADNPEDWPRIPYGTLGERVPDDPDRCLFCYVDHYVWLGNGWFVVHRQELHSRRRYCSCYCHAGEVWLA